MIVPESPLDLGLQFGEWRPGQREAVDQILREFDSHQIVLLSAPTGAGKSLLGVAVSRLLGLPTHIVTYTKQLQQQYARDFGYLVLLGRNNFSCQRILQYSCESCFGKFGVCWNSKCPDYPCPLATKKACCPRCPYHAQFTPALAALNAGNPVLLNYALELALEQHAPKRIPAQLEIYDEAHHLRDALMDHVGGTIPAALIPQIQTTIPRIGSQLSWIQDALWDGFAKANHNLKAAVIAKNPRSYVYWNSVCRTIDQILHNLDADWGVVREGSKLRFTPVWVDELAAELLWKSKKYFLLMSATFLDPFIYAKLVGIQDFGLVKMRVDWDWSRRPIIFAPAQRLSKSTSDYSPLIAAIDRILEYHAHQKGLIHSISHKLAQIILAKSKHSSRMIYTGNDRQAMITRFLESDSNLVLISPSCETGLDLPWDQCRFIIWAKIPFGDLGDPIQVRIASESPEVYRYEAAFRFIQGCGRGFRAPDDWCLVYVLDGHFGWFYRTNRNLFPDWIASSIRYVKQ